MLGITTASATRVMPIIETIFQVAKRSIACSEAYDKDEEREKPQLLAGGVSLEGLAAGAASLAGFAAGVASFAGFAGDGASLTGSPRDRTSLIAESSARSRRFGPGSNSNSASSTTLVTLPMKPFTTTTSPRRTSWSGAPQARKGSSRTRFWREALRAPPGRRRSQPGRRTEPPERARLRREPAAPFEPWRPISASFHDTRLEARQ